MVNLIYRQICNTNNNSNGIWTQKKDSRYFHSMEESILRCKNKITSKSRQISKDQRAPVNPWLLLRTKTSRQTANLLDRVLALKGAIITIRVVSIITRDSDLPQMAWTDQIITSFRLATCSLQMAKWVSCPKFKWSATTTQSTSRVTHVSR